MKGEPGGIMTNYLTKFYTKYTRHHISQQESTTIRYIHALTSIKSNATSDVKS